MLAYESSSLLLSHGRGKYKGGSVGATQHSRYYSKDDQYVSHEDILSFIRKACYVKYKRFGGLTVWNLDLDDFTGKACDDGKFPLVSRASAILLRADDKTCENMEMIPTSRMRSTSGADRLIQSKTLLEMMVTLLWIIANVYV